MKWHKGMYAAGPGPAFQAGPLNIGVGHSGSGNVLGDGEAVGILAVSREQIQPGGCDGLATVHVSCRDISVIPPAPLEKQNSMVLLDVAWQSGIGGGEFQIDCTQGTMFTVGGSQVIDIRARLVSVIAGAPLVPWASKRVEANVHWYGSTVGQCMMSLPSVVVAGAAPSVFQRIPLQAKSMIALGDTPALFPALTANFSTDGTAAGVKYSTLNPNANGSPIVHGVEWVNFTTTDAAVQLVFAVFELYP